MRSLSDPPLNPVEAGFQSYLQTMFRGTPLAPEYINELRKAFFGGAMYIHTFMVTAPRKLTQREFDEGLTALKQAFDDMAGSLPADSEAPFNLITSPGGHH